MRSTYSTRVITIEVSSEGGLPACRREATPSAIAGNAGWTWTTRYSTTWADEALILASAFVAGWVSHSRPGISAAARFAALATAAGVGMQVTDPVAAAAVLIGGTSARSFGTRDEKPVFDEPARLIVSARDYDGGTKCWVRFDEGEKDDIVPGSRVEMTDGG